MTSYPKIVNLTSLLDAILGRLPKSHTLHKSNKFALHTAKQATNQPSIQQLWLVTKARKASFVPTPDLLKNRDEVEVGAIVSLLNSMTLKMQSFLLAKVVSVVHGLFACYVQRSREGCVDKLDGMTAGYPRKIQNQKKKHFERNWGECHQDGFVFSFFLQFCCPYLPVSFSRFLQKRSIASILSLFLFHREKKVVYISNLCSIGYRTFGRWCSIYASHFCCY